STRRALPLDDDPGAAPRSVVRRGPADLAKDHFFGRLFIMFFICSIELLRASSAPGGLVARVPVVWDSSLHPHTKPTDASAAGRIRLPIKNDVALERIGYLSFVVSADGPWTLTGEASL